MSDVTCPQTGEPSASGLGLCGHCLLTLGLADPADEATAIRPGSSSDPTSTGGRSRVTPGAILAGRFRVSGFIGRGGMGEIYRALDLKLGQTVAIKFIAHEKPPAEALRRFYDEVRLGRQVAHPSVCRVYELVEIDGRPFIVMEFVEGENLAALLKRVGRFPYRNALKIAREVCAGIAAAHERGISHGDLKPANVMIDERGHARITDFGLARLAGDQSVGLSGGTLAYMAPEQFGGSESSERTDIYALGLVLFEIFTGVRAHDVSTVEQAAAECERMPQRPSTLQPRIGAETERMLLRCLATNPDERPESARKVLEVLGGGDSLDVVMLAGETPSPEYVAASRKVEQLRPWQTWALLASCLVALVAVVMLSDRMTLYGRAELTHTPAALTARARDLAQRLGGAAPIADEGSWFEANLPYAAPGTAAPPGAYRFPPILFHYRSSRAPLAPIGPDGILRADDPPMAAPGMVHVVLSPRGELLRLESLAPADSGGAPLPGDSPFNEAGLDRTKLTRIESRWRPPVPRDFAAEWRLGTSRVRAAVLGNHISWFEISDPAREDAAAPRMVQRLADTLYTVVLFAAVMVGVFLARTNIRLRRVDRRGAARLTIWVFVCRCVYGLLAGHHPFALQQESSHLGAICSAALLIAAEVLVAYLALEPFVRRRWPALMIGWMRFGQGRFRDSVVGRDVLAGVLAGLLFRLFDHLRNAAPLLLPSANVIPSHLAVELLGSTRAAIAAIFYYHARAIFFALFALFLLLLLHLIVRIEALAVVLWIAVATAMFIRWGEPRVDIPVVAAQMTVLLLTMRRFGLLSLTAALFTAFLTVQIPLTLDVSRFYFVSSSLVGMIVVALSIGGAVAAFSRRWAPGAALPDARFRTSADAPTETARHRV